MIKDLRDNDFRQRCLQIFRRHELEGRTPCLREVVVKAIDSPAPCYYVSHIYAYDKLSRFRHGAGMPRGNGPRDRMWREIAAAVDAERAALGITYSAALANVLNFRRPSSFFISLQEGMRIAREAFERRIVYRPRRAARH
ncbi:MAG: hypothetical protein K2F97_08240 [Muribaculaceae bacterium]|nr:hypothetical protein [Muribaculaceae bacterium]MDE6486038.1 hypothetical protein [Muribaculaceae bacterium]